MSCSEEDDESFSQEEASQEEESIAEEVKSIEDAPSKKTEAVNIPAVVVIKP
jgi:hypothetical protein